jgi:hypothetical protein
VERPLTSGPRGWTGQPHLVASRRLASQSHSPRGGRGESQAEGRWMSNSMVGRPRG